jgi:pimeloyl-ACP methyl ester carboxylesterase
MTGGPRLVDPKQISGVDGRHGGAHSHARLAGRPITRTLAIRYLLSRTTEISEELQLAWYGPEGCRVYYEDTGQGDPVLLLPGWGGNIAEFGGLRRELACGFRVIAADLPGSGRSEPQPRRYEPGYYLRDAQTLLGLLDARGIAAAHLVGFSDGGEEALLMAAARPGCALSVVTWGAAGQVAATIDDLTAIGRAIDHPSEALLPLAAYLADAYGAETARIMTGTWAAAMRGIVAAGGDISRSRAAAITCPALLITGTHDEFCPPDMVREMADAIPRGQFVEAEGAGHPVHLRNGAWLTSTVMTWLSNH